MYPAIVILSSIVFTTFCLLLFLKRSDKAFDVFLKILTFVFCGVGFFRFMLSDAFIYVAEGVWVENGQSHNAWFQLILRWGYYLNYAVLPMAVFFKSRLFKNVASYVCLPFSILSAIFLEDYMVYFFSPMGSGLHLATGFRYAYFMVELAMAISIPLLFQIRERYYFNFKDKWEWIHFFTLLPVIVLTMIPVYAPKAIFGNVIPELEAYSIEHIVWILAMLLLIMLLYYVFRFRSYRDRYMLCVFLVIVLFFHYNSLYLKGFTLKRLPVQLCNIAAFFYLVAIPLRLKKMFHFCFIANVVGAIIAIMIPDFQGGFLDFWSIHYILEHTLVLIIPALGMGLRIFPRLEVKSILYLLVGFSAYFLFVFTIGTILNGNIESSLDKVNYFYLFDRNFIFDKAKTIGLGAIKVLGDVVWRFGTYEIYPLFISFIYAGFFLLCLLFYALTKFLYKIEDDHLNLRLSSITLYEELTGKTSKRPKTFLE